MSVSVFVAVMLLLIVVSVSKPYVTARFVDKLNNVSFPVTVACHVSIMTSAGPRTVVVKSMTDVIVLIFVTVDTCHL